MWQANIIKAIESRTLIEVTYKSERRLVEPHVLGYMKSKLELRVWQLRNYSDGSAPEDWRTFDVNKISSVASTENRFAGVRLTKSGNHDDWDRIIARVL